MGGFSGDRGNTVPSHFAALVGRDPSLPLLTYYDDATGERTELSGATLANWVSKTANLLVDGLGLGPGDRLTAWLPPHWQTAAVLLGAWSAGLTVAYGEPGAAGADVEFASLAAVEAGAPAGGNDRYVLGLAPMGMPLRETPEGWLDYVTEVRVHGDVFPGAAVTADTVALLDPDGTAIGQGALMDRAASHASTLGMAPDERVLIDADAYPYPMDWLLAPLAVGASLVMCVHTDPKQLPKRIEVEKAAELVGPTL